MKKATLLFVVLIVSCSATLAQPRAFGGRIAFSIGASGQYNIGKENMLQADVELLGLFTAVQASVTYNWLFPIKRWKNSELNAFAGVGAGGGYAWDYYLGIVGLPYDNFDSCSNCWDRFWFIGGVGNLGLELNFKSGLQLSVEWRPIVAPAFFRGIGAGYYLEGLYIGAWAVGVRYKFN